ncbi:MAG: DNA polymerase III subunit delta [Proteobacteria bacterium]|nr:DNA polymerase III subunit delta [Pseudomonadota bacterium]
MDMLSVIEGLNANNLEAVYLLHGPERFLIEQMISRIKSIVLQGPMSGFNCVRIKAEDVSGNEIASLAQEIPMMASKRVLIVENGHKLKTDDLAALDAYLGKPAPETCLVIIAERFDLRLGPLKRANKRGQIYKAELLKERGIAPFVRSRAMARGVSIAQGAISAISVAVGPDCAALDDAVERLGLFVGPDRKVTEEDVAEVVTAVREHSVFELVDAIGNKRPSQALSVLEGLLSRREEPLKINAMVARHFRLLTGARIHIHLRTEQREIAGLLGVPPFVASKLVNQARQFNGAELEGSLARLARADYELKSSRRPPQLVVEQAVLDLCLSS